MRPGQSAKIHIDANGRDYKGHVDSIAGSSGARTSLLPPENATGQLRESSAARAGENCSGSGREQRPQPATGNVRRTQGVREVSASAAITAPREFERPAINPWIIALTVTLATFMEVLDTSVANVALPHIAGSLSAGQDESTWVLTSYLVSNAIVLPMSGWFSSLIGRKRFYMTCVALFTISSCLCGFAPSLGLADFFPHSARRGRRRAAAERTSDSGGYVSAEAARDGVRRVRNGGGAGAGHRADARRMDHR